MVRMREFWNEKAHFFAHFTHNLLNFSQLYDKHTHDFCIKSSTVISLWLTQQDEVSNVLKQKENLMSVFVILL